MSLAVQKALVLAVTALFLGGCNPFSVPGR